MYGFEQARDQIKQSCDRNDEEVKSQGGISEYRSCQSRQSDGMSAALTSRTTKQVTINLESVILLENKLLRVFNSVRSLKQVTQKTQNAAALNVYAA